jgi:hypothetical protein
VMYPDVEFWMCHVFGDPTLEFTRRREIFCALRLALGLPPLASNPDSSGLGGPR